MRLSKHDYYVKREKIRTALIRGFTDAEIMAAENIGERQLRRYKESIRKANIKTVPEICEEQHALFIMQIRRFEDVIRQANRAIMAGRGRIGTLLRVINDATSSIIKYMQRVGYLATAPPKPEPTSKTVKIVIEDYTEDDSEHRAEVETSTHAKKREMMVN
jgi:hypothetical protein